MELDETPELRALLAAAAAPARPHELVGEEAAIAGFRREYRPVNRRRRRLALAAVAAFAAASVGGTAYAAGTGHLPGPVREWLGEADRPPATGAAPRPGQPSTARPPAPTATPTRGETVVPADACRVYLAHREDPHARQITAAERKELTRLAGDESSIEGYCRQLLGVTPSDNGKKPKPSHPVHPTR
ncbi:hypothetical protein [Dactylosporangium sp. CA-092794]|uniref:hypothetical protein n=1 Tax=Dactylosporangium sp. CA-092794 TaxID=3239929 RepID=UPI003D90952E